MLAPPRAATNRGTLAFRIRARHDPPPVPARPLHLAIAFAVLCGIWGTSWLAIAEGLDDLPPLSSAAARIVLAWLVLLVLAPTIARWEGGTRAPWWLAAAMGTLNIAYSYSVIYLTEKTLPSGLVSLLWGVFPLLMLVAGVLFLGERLRTQHVIGFAGGMLGLGLLFATDLARTGDAGIASAAFLLTSPIASATSQIFVKKFGQGMSAALLTRDALAVGSLLLVPAALLFERDAPRHWTGSAIASVVYLAVVATAFAFVLYYWLLRHVRSSKLSTIAYITPVLALTLGWLFRDEPLELSTLSGAALVLGSVALVIRVR